MIGSDRQHTLNAALSFEGIGLHTGEHATLTIEPGEPNTGYVFVRVDLDEDPEIPALAGNVSETRRGTTLAANNATVHTTEHVLAALYANGVDNARLLLHGEEVPILDGSSLPFVEAIVQAGTKEQDAPRKFFKVRRNIAHRDEHGCEMLLVPSDEDGFKLTVMVDYSSPHPWNPARTVGRPLGVQREHCLLPNFCVFERSRNPGRARAHQRRGHRQCSGACRA